MKIIAVEMPKVASCQTVECVYNKKYTCNARAITVGDGIEPRCDTFFSADQHVRKQQTAGVGACKVSSCRFNEEYECQADQIVMGTLDNITRCKTYKSRA